MWVIVLLSFLVLPVLIKCTKKKSEPSPNKCDEPLPSLRRFSNISNSAVEKKSEMSKTLKTEKSKTEKPSETNSKSYVKPIARKSSNTTVSALKSSNTDIKPVPPLAPIIINKEGLNILRSKLSAMKNKKTTKTSPQVQNVMEREKSVDDLFLSKSGEDGNGFGFEVQKGGKSDLKETKQEGVAKTQEDVTQKTKKSKKRAAKNTQNTRTRNDTKDTQEALTNQTMISTDNVKTTVEVKCTVDTTVVSTKTKGNIGITQMSQD